MKKKYTKDQQLKIQMAHAEYGMQPYHYALENIDPKIKKQISDYNRKTDFIGFALSAPIVSIAFLGQSADLAINAVEVLSVVSFAAGQGILHGRFWEMGSDAAYAAGVAKGIERVEQMFNESVLEGKPRRVCAERFQEYVTALCGPIEPRNSGSVPNFTPSFA